jgi:O-antigen ligase
LYLAIDPGWSLLGGAVDAISDFSTRGQSAEQLAALSGREEMWTAMWESFELSPWIGHGYFVTSETGEIYVWYMWANWTAHNFWLQTLVTTGIVGAIFMAGALAFYVVGLLRRAADGRIGTRPALFAGAILAWQFLWGLTNESFVGPVQPESVVFFAALGLTLAQFSRGPQAAAKHANPALP